MSSPYAEYAKSNPRNILAMVAAFICVILALVAIFSIKKVDVTKLSDEETKKNVTNTKRATTGLLVMAILTVLSMAANHFYKKHGASSASAKPYFF